MAGSDSRFDATKFRDAIHFVMGMGDPTKTVERISWHWTPTRTFAEGDPAGFPLLWGETAVTTDAPAPVTIECAFEFAPAPGGATRIGGTGMGEFDTASMIITVLDDDYPALLNDQDVLADLLEVDGNFYNVKYVEPPQGLFDVTVYRIHAQAVDES